MLWNTIIKGTYTPYAKRLRNEFGPLVYILSLYRASFKITKKNLGLYILPFRAKSVERGI